MAFNEKILTSDVVEVLDVKIFTTNDHPNIFTLAGERYDDVLAKLQLQLLDADQKAAFDAVISTPSASNPVVLKLDIPIYYPPSDLGEIKDSVPTLGDLPQNVSPTGDITLASTTVNNVSNMTSVLPQQLVSGAGIAADTYIVSVGVNSFEMNLPATATTTGVVLNVSSAVGDVRPVLAENALYRWDGTVWVKFISTGTLDHTQLINQDGDFDFQHLTTIEKSQLMLQGHTHANLDQLELIMDAGSGIIISNDERNRLPSADEKNALLGTQGIPSITNRYTTNADPRLNTAKNPYITVGESTVSPILGPPSEPGINPEAFHKALESISSFECTVSVANPAVITTNHIYENLDIVFFRTSIVGVLGSTTSGSTTISDVSAIDKVKVGYVVTGAGIPASTTVVSVGVNSFELSNPATATNTGPVPPFGASNPGIPLTLTSVLPGGIAADTVYYVRNATATTFNISLLPAGVLTEVTVAASGPIFVGGNNQYVKAIEVLPYLIAGNPADYPMTTGDNIRWEFQEDGFLLESFVPGEASFFCVVNKDFIEILPPGTGPVTIRGLCFKLSGINTRGILVQRDNCVFEDCEFIGLNNDGENHKGITVLGKNIKISNCSFSGFLVSGIDVGADDCKIERCKFQLNSQINFSINVLPSVNNTKIHACRFDTNTLNVGASSTNTLISENHFGADVTVIDAGVNTRFTSMPSHDLAVYGQALYGKTKTLGPLGSFADYRGNNQAIFNMALSDPYVQDVLILPGTYNFTSTVIIPAGKKVKGVTENLVQVLGASTITPFELSSNSAIENISVVGIEAACVNVLTRTNALIKRCFFSVTTASLPEHFGVYVLDSENIDIRGCNFSGVNGLKILDSTKVSTYSNTISSTQAIAMNTNCTDCQIKDNYIMAGTSLIAGSRLIVEGNHFIVGAPSKLSTTDSVWENNWEHPTANNFGGVDYKIISLDHYLQSRSPGCQRVNVLNFGGLSFLKTGDAQAITLPINLGIKVDKTSGIDVKLHWTSNATSGDVQWQVKLVFRDVLTGMLGTPQVLSGSSSRTNISLNEEEVIVLSFPASYGIATDPTHMSVEVSRLAFDPGDTLPTDVVLVAGEVHLRREL